MGKIRRLDYKQFLYFLLYVNSLKKFFVSKTKFNCFKKMSIFSYSLLPKILKLRRSSLRLVFLIKIVYNQFLILKNYRLWHWIRSFIWFIPTNLGSVIFDQPAKPQIPNWCRVSWNFIKFEIKKGVWKRGKQTIIEAGFPKKHWREGGNGKVEGMKILPGRASISRYFCHAKGNIQ